MSLPTLAEGLRHFKTLIEELNWEESFLQRIFSEHPWGSGKKAAIKQEQRPLFIMEAPCPEVPVDPCVQAPTLPPSDKVGM